MIESVLDELAHKAGVDPVALTAVLPRATRSDFAVRAATRRRPSMRPGSSNVLKLVVERSGWGAQMPKGRGRGLAVHFTFGGYAAQVADVSVDANNRLRVHRVIAVIDVGLPINPLNLEAQTEGRHHRRVERGALRRDHDRARTHGAEHVRELPAAQKSRRSGRSTCTSCPAASDPPVSAKLRCRPLLQP